jgi:outer membrane biosynthesis protein TonB
LHCTKTISHTLVGSDLQQSSPLAGINTARGATKSIVAALALGVLATVMTGCGSRRMPPHTPAPIPTPAPAPVITPQPDPAPPAASASRLPPVAAWADYRRRAAQMIVAANPGASFVGPQPLQWSGIATVTVMLNADGSIRALDLMRGSRISPEVNDLALAAVRRAGNYGPVSNLPQPWQFNETFLYNDANKFQLVTIVEGR